MFNKTKASIMLLLGTVLVCVPICAYVRDDVSDKSYDETISTANEKTDSEKHNWIYYNGNKYIYFDSSLCPHTYDENTGLYEQYKGPVKPGWIKFDDKWYYLNEDGSKKTGWFNDGGKWYYLYKTGAMAKNVVIDCWYVGLDGAWDGITLPEAKKMEAFIKTEKDVYEQGVSEIKYTLNNNTVDEMGLGMHCILEKYENGKWSLAPTKEKLTFNEIEWLIDPCTSYEETFSLKPYKDLTPGRYRLNYEGMCSEFEIK